MRSTNLKKQCMYMSNIFYNIPLLIYILISFHFFQKVKFPNSLGLSASVAYTLVFTVILHLNYHSVGNVCWRQKVLVCFVCFSCVSGVTFVVLVSFVLWHFVHVMFISILYKFGSRVI